MPSKTDVVAEYIKNGGAAGYARRIFLEEMKKAEADKKHILRPVVSKLKRGKPELAMALLIKIFMKTDLPEPLNIPATFFGKVLASQEMLKYAEKNYNDTSLLAGLPVEIIQWATVGIVTKENKAAAGRKKGKRNKEKVIAAWEASNKKRSIPAFAAYYFKQEGGSYDAEGKKQGAAPSVRTIERYIREHEKKKSTLF